MKRLVIVVGALTLLAGCTTQASAPAPDLTPRPYTGQPFTHTNWRSATPSSQAKAEESEESGETQKQIAPRGETGHRGRKSQSPDTSTSSTGEFTASSKTHAHKHTRKKKNHARRHTPKSKNGETTLDVSSTEE